MEIGVGVWVVGSVWVSYAQCSLDTTVATKLWWTHSSKAILRLMVILAKGFKIMWWCCHLSELDIVLLMVLLPLPDFLLSALNLLEMVTRDGVPPTSLCPPVAKSAFFGFFPCAPLKLNELPLKKTLEHPRDLQLPCNPGHREDSKLLPAIYRMMLNICRVTPIVSLLLILLFLKCLIFFWREVTKLFHLQRILFKYFIKNIWSLRQLTLTRKPVSFLS